MTYSFKYIFCIFLETVYFLFPHFIFLACVHLLWSWWEEHRSLVLFLVIECSASTLLVLSASRFWNNTTFNIFKMYHSSTNSQTKICKYFKSMNCFFLSTVFKIKDDSCLDHGCIEGFFKNSTNNTVERHNLFFS